LLQVRVSSLASLIWKQWLLRAHHGVHSAIAWQLRLHGNTP
jgi:hypothetical protein